jgi:hypothetical protein
MGMHHAGGSWLMHLIEGKLNAAKYIEILWTAFFGTLADYRLSPFDITFQHDCDPKLTTWLTQCWLLAKCVDVLPWPSKSPELNISEHVWTHLKQQVHTHNPPPCNISELWNIVQEEWKLISPEFIAALYDSMPQRVQAVYTAKGGNTHD